MTLVTGGASGLGRATVERFIKKGSNVVLCDLPTSAGSQIAKDLGEHAHYVNADITSEGDVQNLINEVETKFGRLDVLVNCAGRANAFVTYNFNTKKPRSLEDFQSIIQVNARSPSSYCPKSKCSSYILISCTQTNVVGTMNVIRIAAGLIAKNSPNDSNLRGVIINTSGAEAFNGTTGQVATAAASGAINSLNEPLASEFAAYGIRVVSIAPGLIRSPLCDHFPPEVEASINEIVLSPQRFGHADEFAHVVQTIVTNHYINATTIDLSAGLNLNM